MDQYDCSEALDFLKSGIASGERREELKKSLTKDLPDILTEFYSALKKSGISDILPEGDKLNALHGSQQRHWQRLFSQEFDAEAQSRADKIGHIHLAVGLPTDWYVAAYGRALMKLLPSVTKQYSFRHKELDAVLTTLLYRAFADMSVSICGYGKAAVDKATSDMRDLNLSNLGNMSRSVVEINDLMLQVALLRKNSEDAASNSQTISAAATEMVASVKELSRNSDAISEEARDTNNSVMHGRDSIQKMSGTMSHIAASVDETSSNVEELAKASEQINQIIGVIENIAAQTNLLALNATIEAARAGEAGKGFAIVAAEVKNLANQTSRSTEDIVQKVSQLRDGMANIQKTMETSTSAVLEGEESIQQTSGLMNRVSEQIGSVSSNMTEISSILSGQKEASAEVAENIGNIAAIATDNESMVSKVAASLSENTDYFAKRAREMYDESSPASLCYVAKIDHILFKRRVLNTCIGGDNWTSADVPDHHSCRLGNWYDQIARSDLKSSPTFIQLVEPHKEVHASAKRALDAHAADNEEEMLKALHQLDESCNVVVSLLDKLAEELIVLESKKPVAA